MVNSVQLLLARNVRYFRTRLKLTQFQLSELMDCSPSFIGFIENGKSSVSFATIEALCTALQVTPEELFTVHAQEEISEVREAAPGYSPQMARLVFDIAHLFDKYNIKIAFSDFILTPEKDKNKAVD